MTGWRPIVARFLSPAGFVAAALCFLASFMVISGSGRPGAPAMSWTLSGVDLLLGRHGRLVTTDASGQTTDMTDLAFPVRDGGVPMLARDAFLTVAAIVVLLGVFTWLVRGTFARLTTSAAIACVAVAGLVVGEQRWLGRWTPLTRDMQIGPPAGGTGFHLALGLLIALAIANVTAMAWFTSRHATDEPAVADEPVPARRMADDDATAGDGPTDQTVVTTSS